MTWRFNDIRTQILILDPEARKLYDQAIASHFAPSKRFHNAEHTILTNGLLELTMQSGPRIVRAVSRSNHRGTNLSFLTINIPKVKANVLTDIANGKVSPNYSATCSRIAFCVNQRGNEPEYFDFALLEELDVPGLLDFQKQYGLNISFHLNDKKVQFVRNSESKDGYLLLVGAKTCFRVDRPDQKLTVNAITEKEFDRLAQYYLASEKQPMDEAISYQLEGNKFKAQLRQLIATGETKPPVFDAELPVGQPDSLVERFRTLYETLFEGRQEPPPQDPSLQDAPPPQDPLYTVTEQVTPPFPTRQDTTAIEF